MATMGLLEKHFYCSICQDQLCTPRRLTCGHVYCHDCLDDLIIAKTDYYWIRRRTVRSFGFPCPECRRIIRIPRPDEPCERWVYQINKDFKLDGILTDFKDIIYELDWEERQDQDTDILLENTKTGTQVVQDKASVDLTIEVSANDDDTNRENTSEQVEERAVQAELEDREKNEKKSFPEENENTPPQTRPEVPENTSINSNTGASEGLPEIHPNTKLQVDQEDVPIGFTIGLSIIADDTMPETESDQVAGIEAEDELYEREKKENDRLVEENDIQTNFTTPKVEENSSINSTIGVAAIDAIPETDLQQVEGIEVEDEDHTFITGNEAEDELYEREKEGNERLVEENDIQTNFTTPEIEETASIDSTMGAADIKGKLIKATKDLLEKYFNCSICQNQLSTPRRLNCGHVYCHDCLDGHIRLKTGHYWIRRRTVQSFGFPCPECRKVLKIPRPDEPCERWVHQINKDFKLDGILADLKDIIYERDWEERLEQDTEILLENTKTSTQAVQHKASVDLTIEVSANDDDTNRENASEQIEDIAVEAELEDRQYEKKSCPEENENTPPQTRSEVEENTSIISNTGASERSPEIQTNTKLQVVQEDASIGLNKGVFAIADDTMPETESDQVEERAVEAELEDRKKNEKESFPEENDNTPPQTKPGVDENTSINSNTGASERLPEENENTPPQTRPWVEENTSINSHTGASERSPEENKNTPTQTRPRVEEKSSINSNTGAAERLPEENENTPPQTRPRVEENTSINSDTRGSERLPEENENTPSRTRPEVEENTSINSNTGASERLPEENHYTPPQTRLGFEENTSINSNTGASERLPEENENTPTQTRPEVEENTSINFNTGASERLPEENENTPTQTRPRVEEKSSINSNTGASERLPEGNENTPPQTRPWVEEKSSINSNTGAAERLPEENENTPPQTRPGVEENTSINSNTKASERLPEENKNTPTQTRPRVEEKSSINSNTGASERLPEGNENTPPQTRPRVEENTSINSNIRASERSPEENENTPRQTRFRVEENTSINSNTRASERMPEIHTNTKLQVDQEDASIGLTIGVSIIADDTMPETESKQVEGIESEGELNEREKKENEIQTNFTTPKVEENAYINSTMWASFIADHAIPETTSKQVQGVVAADKKEKKETESLLDFLKVLTSVDQVDLPEFSPVVRPNRTDSLPQAVADATAKLLQMGVNDKIKPHESVKLVQKTGSATTVSGLVVKEGMDENIKSRRLNLSTEACLNLGSWIENERDGNIERSLSSCLDFSTYGVAGANHTSCTENELC